MIVQIESLEGEEWIDVIGTDGIYEVSNYGRVKSIGRYVYNGSARGRWVNTNLLKPITYNKRVYITISLDGLQQKKLLSELVYYSFKQQELPNYLLDAKDDWREITHIDGDFTNNCLSNLQLNYRENKIKEKELNQNKINKMKKKKNAPFRPTLGFTSEPIIKILVEKQCQRDKINTSKYLQNIFYSNLKIDKDIILSQSIDILGLSERPYSALKIRNINTLGDLVNKEQNLLRADLEKNQSNFGSRSMEELKNAIQLVNKLLNEEIHREEGKEIKVDLDKQKDYFLDLYKETNKIEVALYQHIIYNLIYKYNSRLFKNVGYTNFIESLDLSTSTKYRAKKIISNLKVNYQKIVNSGIVVVSKEKDEEKEENKLIQEYEIKLTKENQLKEKEIKEKKELQKVIDELKQQLKENDEYLEKLEDKLEGYKNTIDKLKNSEDKTIDKLVSKLESIIENNNKKPQDRPLTFQEIYDLKALEQEIPEPNFPIISGIQTIGYKTTDTAFTPPPLKKEKKEEEKKPEKKSIFNIFKRKK
jgi:hypothetical protein